MTLFLRDEQSNDFDEFGILHFDGIGARGREQVFAIGGLPQLPGSK